MPNIEWNDISKLRHKIASFYYSSSAIGREVRSLYSSASPAGIADVLIKKLSQLDTNIYDTINDLDKLIENMEDDE
jgi:uncharacterized protein with HEPN domain